MVAALAGTARANEVELFDIEATLGVYDGFGLGARVGDGLFGVHLLAGWQPLIVTSQSNDFPPEPHIDFYSTLQANVDLYLTLMEPTPRSSFGLTAGYKASNYLGHGGGLGFHATIDAREQVSYFIIGGVTWFPRGEERLRERKPIPEDHELTFPGPEFNAGANFGVAFSP